MRPRIITLSLVAGFLLTVPSLSLVIPRAQTIASNYSFTMIAEHGFLQVVPGDGLDPVPQVIDASGVGGFAINDDGIVAIGHGSQSSGRRTISVGDGSSIGPVVDASVPKSTNLVGIDGFGRVYYHDGQNIVTLGGLSLADATGWAVNGAHPLLLPASAVHAAFYFGGEIRTEDGLIAAPGEEFSMIGSDHLDLNSLGEVVFTATTASTASPADTTGIFAARDGEPARAVFLNYENPGRVGFTSIRSPRIDDTGRIYFSASPPGALQFNLYRIDAESQDPVLLIDGNTGPLRLPSSIAVAVNATGALVFLAERATSGVRGIYTGPNPDADKVIEVGDELAERTIENLWLGQRAINNGGGGIGQILFAAQLAGDTGASLYRADPNASGLGLTGLTLKTSTVAGCKAVKGMVTISEPAPSGGVVVSLSDTLAAASVPAAVTIPARKTRRAFKITTQPVSGAERGTVSATYGTTTLSAELTVRPMGVQSVALTPNPAVGGTLVNGVVNLECNAAPGSILVDLESSHVAVAATTPSTVTVSVGSKSAPFTVMTTAVSVKTKAKITATANGVVRAKTLTVTP